MMTEKRINEIDKQQKDVTRNQEVLYERQRSADRLTDGIGTYFRQTQQLLQKTREVFRKNDGGRDFDELYSFFFRDAGKTMEALGEEKREIKRTQQLLEEQNQALVKEKKSIHSEERSNEY